MGINVNVSVESLRQFAGYVDNFSKYVDGDCAQLQGAISALATTMDSDSIAVIKSSVEQITRILDEQAPTIKTLEQKVNNYADFVERLKAAAGN